MNKLTIKKGNDQYDILVDNYKVIYGSNAYTKFDIKRTLIAYFKELKPSEHGRDTNNTPYVAFNDQPIRQKESQFYNVTPYFSLSDDFKLTAKSLTTKYYETLLGDNDFYDSINSLNILFQSLGQEIEDSSLFGATFTSMVPKQLLKLLTPYYMIEDNIKNEFDLSLDEIIILQLKLIKYITDHNSTFKICIVCVNIPQLTQVIFEIIHSIQNAIILIFLETKNHLLDDINKYYICEKINFDLASEESLYSYICDNDFNLLTLNEGRDLMRKYLFEEPKNVELMRKLHLK